MTQRHWFLSGSLLLLACSSLLMAVAMFFLVDDAERITHNIPVLSTNGIGILGLVNLFFLFLIFKWKKMGFFGLMLTTLLQAVISYNVGVSLPDVLFGTCGLGLLCLALFFKKNGQSGWASLV